MRSFIQLILKSCYFCLPLNRHHMTTSILSAIKGTEHGIVSKKLLGSNGGNITLFAFDKGESLEKHSTPHKAMVLALEGEATFSIGNTTSKLKKDDFLTLAENEEHSLEATTEFKMLLIIIKS